MGHAGERALRWLGGVCDRSACRLGGPLAKLGQLGVDEPGVLGRTSGCMYPGSPVPAQRGDCPASSNMIGVPADATKAALTSAAFLAALLVAALLDCECTTSSAFRVSKSWFCRSRDSIDMRKPFNSLSRAARNSHSIPNSFVDWLDAASPRANPSAFRCSSCMFLLCSDLANPASSSISCSRDLN